MRPLLSAIVLLCAVPSASHADELFGSGQPPIFRRQEMDRRFERTKLAKALQKAPGDPACQQVVGALFTALAEIAPTLHKRDENFTIDPHLLNALQHQLNTPVFPGPAYLSAMVRQVLIAGKMPRSWLTAATSVNAAYQVIDLAKLRYLAEGVRPIDSFLFTFPTLKERHALEVGRATTSAQGTAHLAFRDRYLDRDVTWRELVLLDVGPENELRGRKAGRGGDEGELMAKLEYRPLAAADAPMDLFAYRKKKKTPQAIVFARLSERQYLDLLSLPKGRRVMVRGRLWEMNRTVTELQLRDAVLFEDRDWSQGAVLANPAAIGACGFAINELTGSAPSQPGGFRR